LDEDHSQMLEFDEFVRGFYLLSPKASKAEKINFTFKIYDVDGNGDVSRDELLQLLTDVLKEDKASLGHMHLAEEDLRDWVDMSFDEVVPSGEQGMKKDDYARMVELHPAILESLTIPMNFLESANIASFEKALHRSGE
jgi:serine/threonine-protein phosphatase 2B regulatory subunit